MGALEQIAIAKAEESSGVNIVKSFGPQLIIPGHWVLQGVPHYMGGVNIPKRDARLCNKDTKLGRFIRAHELLHAKFSSDMTPAETARYAAVHLETVKSSEDLRVNKLGAKLGIELECFGVTDEEQSTLSELMDKIYKSLDIGEFRSAGLLWINIKPHVGGEGSVLDRAVYNHLCFAYDQEVATDFDTRCNYLIGFAEAMAVTQISESSTVSSYEATRQNILSSLELAALVELVFPYSTQDKYSDQSKANEKLAQAIENPEAPKSREFGQKAATSGTGTVQWGRMKLNTYPMVLVRRTQFNNRKRRAISEGTLLKAFYRSYTDGKMFLQRPRRPQPCNFLIDISGSMPWGSMNLVKLIQTVPKSTVLLYSGSNSVGVLHVIARGNLIVPKQALEKIIKDSGGANAVDMPALEHLNLLRGVKYWVSDGLATCPVGNNTVARAQCMSFIKAKGIELISAEMLQDAVNHINFKTKGKR